ncbi:predicted protein [Verticillium alfalfae VaMs.102]|uniref:Predicted protein n=1 Tax=Verticillium alfalfae (strain VaMs.102 / ATCC MYA-4576 / FGSC 10136) TaxID=526221 RepID=C9SSA9_VERA1|nr:predicted protein [Verticillium alfalfae VaMs.102]EEY21674.1 predicted protein [Verticillium alfalfae VaMs.102]
MRLLLELSRLFPSWCVSADALAFLWTCTSTTTTITTNPASTPKRPKGGAGNRRAQACRPCVVRLTADNLQVVVQERYPGVPGYNCVCHDQRGTGHPAGAWEDASPVFYQTENAVPAARAEAAARLPPDPRGLAPAPAAVSQPVAAALTAHQLAVQASLSRMESFLERLVAATEANVGDEPEDEEEVVIQGEE